MDYHKLPSELQDIYRNIDHDVIMVHAKWIVLNQLFDGSEEKVKLLNRSASFFFGIVQRSFFEDTLLGISRLTDPATTAGKDNLSLEQLIFKLRSLGFYDLVSELEIDLVTINNCCSSFRLWRNKKLAHRDLNTALQVETDLLPSIDKTKIEKVLSLISNFMNKINGHFFDSQTLYDKFITHSAGQTLLGKLKIVDEIEKKRLDDQLKLINDMTNKEP